MDWHVDAWGRLEAAGAMAAGPGPVIPPLPTDHARSPKWPAFLRAFLLAHPRCAGCDRAAVTGHHVIPFHVDPAQELSVANVVAVCLPCHFVLCHCGDWRLTVPSARARLAANLPAVEEAEASAAPPGA